MTIDIDKLREVALGAMPGDWRQLQQRHVVETTQDTRDGLYGHMLIVCGEDADDFSDPKAHANAAFIAAANPAVALELIDELQQRRARDPMNAVTAWRQCEDECAELRSALREACSIATTPLPEDRQRIIELRQLAGGE